MDVITLQDNIGKQQPVLFAVTITSALLFGVRSRAELQGDRDNGKLAITTVKPRY